MLSRWTLLATMVLAIAGCSILAPTDQSMARDVERLQAVLPTIEELQVVMYHVRDDCQALEYPRGLFSSQPDVSTCALSDLRADPFDAQALEDFSRLRDQLEATGVTVQALSAEYADAGNLTSAVFDLPAGFLTRSYVFDPGGRIPQGGAVESKGTRINAAWYLWENDPN